MCFKKYKNLDNQTWTTINKPYNVLPNQNHTCFQVFQITSIVEKIRQPLLCDSNNLTISLLKIIITLNL